MTMTTIKKAMLRAMVNIVETMFIIRILSPLFFYTTSNRV